MTIALAVIRVANPAENSDLEVEALQVHRGSILCEIATAESRLDIAVDCENLVGIDEARAHLELLEERLDTITDRIFAARGTLLQAA